MGKRISNVQEAMLHSRIAPCDPSLLHTCTQNFGRPHEILLPRPDAPDAEENQAGIVPRIRGEVTGLITLVEERRYVPHINVDNKTGKLMENKWYQNPCCHRDHRNQLIPASHPERRKAVSFSRVVETLLPALHSSEVRPCRAGYR